MRRLLLVVITLASSRAIAGSPCEGLKPSIHVSVERKQLTLCSNGRPEAVFDVALGRGGSGKSVEGDRRTPLGSYSLGSPARSKRFHVFIPIGYPTAAQRAKGATGGSVGIHGPDRRFRWAGSANTWVSWTRGCIAVGTDDVIDNIAAWTRRTHPATIHIE